MTSSDGSTTPKRLHILDTQEIKTRYGKPHFTLDDRPEVFTLKLRIKEIVSSVSEEGECTVSGVIQIPRFGQEILIQLAHNLIMWARCWLSEKEPKLAGYVINRWVRDLLTMKGKITFKDNQIGSSATSLHLRRCEPENLV